MAAIEAVRIHDLDTPLSEQQEMLKEAPRLGYVIEVVTQKTLAKAISSARNLFAYVGAVEKQKNVDDMKKALVAEIQALCPSQWGSIEHEVVTYVSIYIKNAGRSLY